MLNFSAASINLCLDPTNMRKSLDTSAAVVRSTCRRIRCPACGSSYAGSRGAG